MALLLTLLAGCYESYELELFPPSPCQADEPTLLMIDESCVEMTFMPTTVRPLCLEGIGPERGSGFRVMNQSTGRAFVRVFVAADTTEYVGYAEHDASSCACGSSTSFPSGVRSASCFAALPLEAGATLEWTVSTVGVAVRVDACPAPDGSTASCD